MVKGDMYGREWYDNPSRNSSVVPSLLLEYNGCACFTIDNITIVTQP
jgi:hypothetical protein